ncbi:DUF6629 family protein [Novosphingobium naphthalenivorans]|uniref:DUF6629 family protein n=1 Tax=Novosphingobium naphthalenivorans TaxID=273168 RepID=UPI000831ECFC|nr:DUF6629 family protein [Novosphingobium naphthalenivorans]
MCFSAEASFTASALLIPSGGVSLYLAAKTDRRYVPLCALPVLFGLQQFFEGMVWVSGAGANYEAMRHYSITYMFFAWLAWPVWIPFATYFVEPCRWRPLYLLGSIIGGMLGATLYFPYFANEGWLTVSFLPKAVVYSGKQTFDFIWPRDVTYAIYLASIVLPPILSTRPEVRVFGLLVFLAFGVTYLFFRFAYISVFCFLGGLVSIYLVLMMARLAREKARADPDCC